MVKEINKKVYKKLIEFAKKQTTISYSQLASECDISYTSIDERNEFHHLLGNISIFEVKHNRPMLSALVHHLGDPERRPGKGFFILADELKQRKNNEDDKTLLYRQMKKCWEVWK